MSEGQQTLGVVVDYDLACIECGYNLRQLPASGACPECGLPIARTIESRRLANPSWVERMSLGMRLLFAVPLCVALMALSPWQEGLMVFVRIASAAAVLAAVWLLTSANPDVPDNADMRCRRWIARAAAGAIALYNTVFPLLPLRMIFNGPEWLGTHEELHQFILIGLACGLALWPLTELAERLNRPRLCLGIRRAVWLQAVAMAPLLALLYGRRSEELPAEIKAELALATRMLIIGAWLYVLLVLGRMVQVVEQVRHPERMPAAGPSADAPRSQRFPVSLALLSALALAVACDLFAPYWVPVILRPLAFTAFAAGVWWTAREGTPSTALRHGAGLRMTSTAAAVLLAVCSIAATISSAVFHSARVSPLVWANAIATGACTWAALRLLAHKLDAHSGLADVIRQRVWVIAAFYPLHLALMAWSVCRARGPYDYWTSADQLSWVCYWVKFAVALELALVWGRAIEAWTSRAAAAEPLGSPDDTPLTGLSAS